MTSRSTWMAVVAGTVLAGCTGSAGLQGPAGPTGHDGARGPTGATGAMGLDGPQGPAGPRGITWAGTWSPSTTYAVGDGVAYQGQSWVAVTESTARPPPSVDWQLLAAQGGQGIQGPAGPTGAQGIQGLQGATGPVGAVGATGPTGLQGPQGIQGPQGAQGIQGVAGPAGSSAAYTVGNLTPTQLGTHKTMVANLTLPQGAYLVTGMVTIQTMFGENNLIPVGCGIFVDSVSQDATWFGRTLGAADGDSIPMTATVTAAVSVSANPGTVSLECWYYGAGLLVGANLRPDAPAVISAIAASSLTTP